MLKNKLLSKYWQYLLLFLIVFLLYGNTLNNKYNLDDDFVVENNVRIQKGVMGIPSLFIEKYSINKDKVFGYRPIVLASFAIEYQIFGENTIINHLVNVLLYFLISVLLLKLLLNFFKDYSIYFIWAVLLLFIAHPVHTEVVASLKNRDELFSFLFSISSLYMLIKYVEDKKNWRLILSLFLFIIAYLSKQSAVVFVLITPLSIYFFTKVKLKKIFIFFLLFLVVFILSQKMPKLFLDHSNRVNEFFENPLFADDGIGNRLLTAVYSAYFYIKLALFPKYLSFYYGYNTLPAESFFSLKSILSILFHLSIFVYAIVKLPKKHPISFGILFYLFSISIFLNIVKPIMGIVADRYLFSAVLGLEIVLVYLLFNLFKKDVFSNNLSKIKLPLYIVSFLFIFFLIKTIGRNNDWFNRITLYNADIEHLENSAKANELTGNTYFYKANHRKNKDREYLKDINNSIKYYRQSLNIYSKNKYMLNDLAYIYMSINKPDSALVYLSKIENKNDINTLFNIAQAYEIKKEFKKSILYYNKVLLNEPINVKALMKLSMLNNHLGNFDEVVKLNNDFIKNNPKVEDPYLNLANLYYINKDTLKAIEYAEKALKINSKNKTTLQIVYNFYKKNGNYDKANYYLKLLKE